VDSPDSDVGSSVACVPTDVLLVLAVLLVSVVPELGPVLAALEEA